MDMDKTEQGRNRPYCWLWLRITWTKTKNFFAQSKNLPQIYMAKIGMQKSLFKIFGGRFLAKISRKLYANRTYSEHINPWRPV